MVGTICPMVHGARTKYEGNKVLLMYSIGSLAGAALTGGAAGVCGALLFSRFGSYRPLASDLAAFLCILYVLDELGFIRLPHPQSHKRVPASWRLGNHQRAAGSYGLALGIGVGTPIPFSAFYIAVVWCVLIGNPVVSALAFLGFGFGRALPLGLLSRFETVDEAANLADSVCWKLPLIHFLNECSLMFSASVLVFNAIRS